LYAVGPSVPPASVIPYNAMWQYDTILQSPFRESQISQQSSW